MPAIKFSPGCACCAPPTCDVIHKLLTDGVGSSFNSTDWSFSGTVVADDVDQVTLDSGTLTPLFTMGANDAYYVRLKIRGSSGSTPKVEVEMASESADVDFGTETIQMNAVTSRTIPTYDLDDWVTVNVYFCPTHTMAQCEGYIDGTAYPDYLTANHQYEETTVDTTSPASITQAWTIKITGDCELSEVKYYPADVEYDGALKIKDCMRHDIFGNNWGFWSQVPSDDVDITDVTEKINLSYTGGSDVSLTQGGTTYDSRFFSEDNGGVLSGTTTGEPLDHYDVTTIGLVVIPVNATIFLFAMRSVKTDNGDGTWDWAAVQIVFEGLVEISRPAPTSSVPYPEPIARAYNNGTETDLGGADTSGDAFIIAGGDVTWDHPYP